MERKTRKKLINAFKNYKRNMQVAVISTVEWAEENMAIDYEKLRVSGSSGNSKEDALIGIIDKAEDRIRWCSVVEKTIEHYTFDLCRSEIIKGLIEHRKRIKILCEGISEATYHRYLNEILEMAQNWAKELRLV